jgi:hypothetical protein
MIPKSKIVNKSFNERLRYGQETEENALSLVKEHYDPDAYLIKGLDKGKDIVAPNQKTKFEVKDQRTAIKCLSVEFARIDVKGVYRYSGIKTTEADFWIWFCKNEYLVINREWLYGLAKEKPTRIYPHRSERYAFKIVDILEVKTYSDYIWTLHQATSRV